MRLALVVSISVMLGTGVWAAPVTNDLWDSSQAGHVAATLVSPTFIICGFAENMFGASLGNGNCPAPEGGERVVFGDQFFVAPVVNVVEWGTAASTITSFSLFSVGDGNGWRDLGSLRLFYWDGSSFVNFYDSGALPGNQVETSPLTASFAGVTSTLWRAELAQAANQSGPRVIELDGFGTLVSTSGVPEPSTIGLAAAGLVVLLVRRRNGSVR